MGPNSRSIRRAGDPSAIIVPNLVNCSARFTSPTVLDRYAGLEGLDFIPVTTYRRGSYQQINLSARKLYLYRNQI